MSNINTVMNNIFNQALRVCIEEIKKPDTNQVLKRELMNPIVTYIGQQIWPYVMVTCIFFTILCVVMVFVVFIICKKHASYQVQ